MTAPRDDDRLGRTVALRELGALLLVVVGVVALLGLAWSADWRLAAALVAVAAIVGGVRLGTTQTDDDDDDLGWRS